MPRENENFRENLEIKVSEKELGDLIAAQHQLRGIKQWLLNSIRLTNKELPFLLQRKPDLDDYQTKIDAAKERAKTAQIQLLNKKIKENGNFNILLPKNTEITSRLNAAMSNYKDIDDFKNLLHLMDSSMRSSDFHLGEWLEKINKATDALSKILDNAVIL